MLAQRIPERKSREDLERRRIVEIYWATQAIGCGFRNQKQGTVDFWKGVPELLFAARYARRSPRAKILFGGDKNRRRLEAARSDRDKDVREAGGDERKV